MLDLKGTATRKDGRIQVQLTGNLRDSCQSAVIRDIYPGGNIQYVRDPGAAQVFVDEFRKPNAEICLFVLFPWTDSVTIPDRAHDTVDVFVNREKVLTLPVTEKPEKPSAYIVIALTGGGHEKHLGCSILPEGTLYPAIYSQVFGPATEAECREYVSGNCGFGGGDPAGGATLLSIDSGEAGEAAAAESIELPLARPTSVQALSYGNDLLLHVSGVTYGFGGKLVVERSPLDIFPPIYIVRESPGNGGFIPGNAPDAAPTVDAYAFPGQGNLESITIQDAGGRRGVRVIRAETVEEDFPGHAPAPPRGEWSAIHDFQPLGPPRLRVHGKLEMPTPGFELTLTRAEPQGINPHILLLVLSITPPSKIMAQVMTSEEVTYQEVTSFPYKQVQILPIDETIEVEVVS